MQEKSTCNKHRTFSSYIEVVKISHLYALDKFHLELKFQGNWEVFYCEGWELATKFPPKGQRCLG